jgi:hypothetical protein
MKPTMVGNKDGYNGTKHNALNIFTLNEKLAKYVKDGQPKAMM